MLMQVHGGTALARMGSPKAVIAMIVRLHGECLQSALRQSLARVHRRTGKNGFYPEALNTAEAELLKDVVPFLQGQDLQSGLHFELAHYSAAIISMIMWYKCRMYEAMAPQKISPQDMASIKLEVFLENIDGYDRCVSEIADPFKRLNRLNELEPQILQLIDQGLTKVSEDIRSTEQAIDHFKKGVEEADRQLKPRRWRWFRRRLDQSTRSVIRGQRTVMAREHARAVQMRGGLKGELDRKIAQKGIKRLAVIQYIAECKLKAIGARADMLVSVAS